MMLVVGSPNKTAMQVQTLETLYKLAEAVLCPNRPNSASSIYLLWVSAE